MQWRNDTNRYGVLAISLHWFMLLLIVAVYACMELNEFFPKGSASRAALKSWHYMLGLSVLVLALLRLIVNATAPTPRIVSTQQGLLKLIAKAMKIALYGLMLGLPVAGWLILSAAGKPIPFFSLTLPPLIAESKTAADLIKEIHEAGATVGYFLIGLHAAAALFHHYVLGDSTLKGMLLKRY